MSVEFDCKTLEIKAERQWITICLNRPDARNALSAEMVDELLQTLETVAENTDVRGITLRGNGGVFCAGGDLKGFKSIFQGDDSSLSDIKTASLKAGALFHRINTMPQVVVMLVEGAAMAGGLGMVCAGDVVAVTEDAKFALTEVTLGIPPAQIAPYIVARLGSPAARRLMLTASRFDGREAAKLGLADFLVGDVDGLEEVERDLRKSVMRCAPEANRTTKSLALQAAIAGPEQMQEAAAEAFAACLAGPEGREGISAFLEKRKPNWATDL